MTMRTKFLFLFVLLSSCIWGQEISVIPMPADVKLNGTGAFLITKNTVISYDKEAVNSADFLKEYGKNIFNLDFATKQEKGAKKAITLSFKKDFNPGQYTLDVDKSGITICGSEDGIFYGVQTLIQLFPTSGTDKGVLSVPYVSIKDEPRFAYRGLLMDVGRYYFPFEFLKKCVDYAALHKMNKFQIHLTDDQGWRLEIKKYPELMRTGAWRAGTMIGLYPGTGYDTIRHGGYYTQEQMKELVAYAKKRYVTVIPEIEMPGHAIGALTSYPYLGCTGGPYKVKEEWGAGDDVFCAGNDKTFTFLQDVLDEVMEIFPSEYIHIGGDECPKKRWEECPKCQLRIKNEGLKDEHELQSYFITRIEKYLNDKGRAIIGWDEILEGGVAPNATVMSWRGDGLAGCLGAVKAERPVIMTPSYGFYLDYPQTSKEDSLVCDWGGVTPVEKTYMFNPVPDTLTVEESKFIIGGQAAIWTEYINNPSKAEYMAYPRLSAVSEVLWSPKRKRDWDSFKQRMQTQYRRYRLWGVNYNPADLDLK